MKMTEYGLRISIEDLEKILADVKNQNEYHDMDGCIYINFEQKTITQYCKYAECFPYTIWR